MAPEIGDFVTFAHSRIDRALRIGRVELKEVARRVTPTTRTRITKEPIERRPIEPGEIDDMVKMWKVDNTVAEIASKHKREWAHVRYYLGKRGINTKDRKRLTVKKRITDYLLAGKSTSEIVAVGLSTAKYINTIERDLAADGRIVRKKAKPGRKAKGGAA